MAVSLYNLALPRNFAKSKSFFENKKESIRRFGENISQESERIRGQLGDLFKKTTVVRIIVEKEGKVVLNIPLTLGVLGVAAMPVLSLLGLSAAVLSKYSVLITDEASGESVDMGSLTPEKLEILKEIIFNSFEDIRGTFKKSKDVEEDDSSDDIIYELIKEEDPKKEDPEEK